MSALSRIHRIRSLRRGFSLVELLVVLAIISIMAAIAIPAINSLLTSYGLSSAGQAVLGQLTSARQQALANNTSVQIRFYQVADYKGNAVYRAVQAFQESTSGSGTTTLTPITKPYFLPNGMWFAYSATLTAPSTLFSTATSGAAVSSTGDSTNPLPPPYGASPYIYFRFRPTGQTDLTASSIITISSETARTVANNLPANFVTLQIDSVNGNIRIYQP